MGTGWAVIFNIHAEHSNSNGHSTTRRRPTHGTACCRAHTQSYHPIVIAARRDTPLEVTLLPMGSPRHVALTALSASRLNNQIMK